MEIEIKRVTEWARVLDACRMTVNKKSIGREPSDEFKARICRSEHSPLRMLVFDITISGVPYWIHTELCRHHVGIEKFVTTSRPDRTHSGLTRHDLPQDALVDMRLSVNAQAIINISRLRLCRQAAAETRRVWRAVIDRLAETEPVLARFCVPNCIYRSRCGEFAPCGYSETEYFAKELNEYWK